MLTGKNFADGCGTVGKVVFFVEVLLDRRWRSKRKKCQNGGLEVRVLAREVQEMKGGGKEEGNFGAKYTISPSSKTFSPRTMKTPRGISQ